MLSIVDETETRRDLASRRESKFVIDRSELDIARSILNQNARRVVHGGHVSMVRSIYFDDVRLSACRANLSGLSHRQKLRLRWYDSVSPNRACYLEVKWRTNRVTGKYRLKIDSARNLSELSYGELLDHLYRCIPPRFSPWIARNVEPIVIVEYRREHFVSFDKKLRATLDYDLTFYDQTGKSRISTAFPRKRPDLVVIEGKTAIGDEMALRALFCPMRLKLSRCSKYVHGCKTLGFIHESE
jgi:VTC domain